VTERQITVALIKARFYSSAMEQHDYIRKFKRDQQQLDHFRNIFPAQAQVLWENLSKALREHLNVVKTELGFEVQMLATGERHFRFIVMAKLISKISVTLDVEARSLLIETAVIKSLSQDFGQPKAWRITLDLDERDSAVAYVDEEAERLTVNQIAQLIVEPSLASAPANVQDLRPRKYGTISGRY